MMPKRFVNGKEFNTVENQQINLSDCIGPAFYSLYWDIMDGKHTYYDLKGGRGSLKSSFVSLMIIIGMMSDSNAHAICYRKVADTLGDSVFSQICWAIDKLGVTHLWHTSRKPMTCTYIPTGQKILFKGLDKAAKSKSVKAPFGYFKYLWFEEFDEFAGAAEIRSVQQSVLRGGQKFVVFKSMNPPRSKSNWANAEMEQDKLRDEVLVSETTYLQAPPEWLGPQFIADDEWIKEVNPIVYRHEYLGEPVGNGTDVFDNVTSRRITDEEISHFDHIYMGIDWGWYPDPFHWGKMHYDSNRRILYIFDEYRTNRTTNDVVWKNLQKYHGVRNQDLITCDSAENKSIGDLRAYGANARPAEKGPDSVRYGMKWLQSLNEIVIDPIRCPNTNEEFTKYEYELDKDGNPTSEFPDANNHSIDMTRYAMERVWRRRGL
jgi:PBSX family phage terminase large subunit